MPLGVQCPHCHSRCQVEPQHLGTRVKCGKCGRPFTAQPPPAGAPPAPAVKVSVRPGPDEEIALVLDGPGALALAAPGPAAPVAHPGPPAFRLEVGGATSPGRVRRRNEDSFLVQYLSWSNLDRRRDIALAVVADGLGGHEAGDQASGLAIRLIGTHLAPLLTGTLSIQTANPSPQVLADAVNRAVKEANREVHRRGLTEPACKGMGATAAVVLVWDGQVQVGHVGDCRVYHCRAGELTQVTRDQTLVERLLELGKLTPQEALTHPARVEVLEAIGKGPEIAPASYQLKLAAGDWLIIACDGLHAHLDAAALREAVRQSGPSAAVLARQLVDLADQGGGSDNCTVVAIRCY